MASFEVIINQHEELGRIITADSAKMALVQALAESIQWVVRSDWPEDACTITISVVNVVDKASGKTADRPEFKRLFEDASRKQFDLVLFWSLDRFSREGVLETLQHLQRLTSYGVEWFSYREEYVRQWACSKKRCWPSLRQWRSNNASAFRSGFRLGPAEGKCSPGARADATGARAFLASYC